MAQAMVHSAPSKSEQNNTQEEIEHGKRKNKNYLKPNFLVASQCPLLSAATTTTVVVVVFILFAMRFRSFADWCIHSSNDITESPCSVVCACMFCTNCFLLCVFLFCICCYDTPEVDITADVLRCYCTQLMMCLCVCAACCCICQHATRLFNSFNRTDNLSLHFAAICVWLVSVGLVQQIPNHSIWKLTA